MTNNVLASSERHRRQESAGGMSGAAEDGSTYDALGMPMSLAAAKSMTEDAILAALRRTLAKLHHESPELSNNSAKIDSIEVVFLVGRFFRNLDCQEPDLSTIDRHSWSSLKGVAEVLYDAIWKLK